MLMVILLRAMQSSGAEGSRKILPSASPKVKESGRWARLSGCCTPASTATSDYSTFTIGFLRSSKVSTVPLSTQSMTFPSSQITLASTATFQTNLPDRMQSDSGSSALEPTITVSSNLASSADSFRLCQGVPWQLWQSTRKKMKPSLGLSLRGAVISTLDLMQTSVAPMRKTRCPVWGRKRAEQSLGWNGSLPSLRRLCSISRLVYFCWISIVEQYNPHISLPPPSNIMKLYRCIYCLLILRREI